MTRNADIAVAIIRSLPQKSDHTLLLLADVYASRTSPADRRIAAAIMRELDRRTS